MLCPIAFHIEMDDITYLHHSLKQDKSTWFITVIVTKVIDCTQQKQIPEEVSPLPSSKTRLNIAKYYDTYAPIACTQAPIEVEIYAIFPPYITTRKASVRIIYFSSSAISMGRRRMAKCLIKLVDKPLIANYNHSLFNDCVFFKGSFFSLCMLMTEFILF
ncbi:hypothetical protein ACHAXS_001430 [Conticribra weissflogii]